MDGARRQAKTAVRPVPAENERLKRAVRTRVAHAEPRTVERRGAEIDPARPDATEFSVSRIAATTERTAMSRSARIRSNVGEMPVHRERNVPQMGVMEVTNSQECYPKTHRNHYMAAEAHRVSAVPTSSMMIGSMGLPCAQVRRTVSSWTALNASTAARVATITLTIPPPGAQLRGSRYISI